MCTCSIFVCRHKNHDMPTLLGHAHTYLPTDRQTDTLAYIHKSIQTYSYTYTWLHMCDVSQDTIKMTCRPCLETYIHTYKQTINQYKQIVIIHKSIQTYSYTYTWLQMVRPPPTHPQGGGGNIMCTCSIFVCRHQNHDMPTLVGHSHTYLPTDRQTDTLAYIHKSIQTYSYTYTWLHMCDVSQDTIKMTCRPCLETYIHTYKQTINQYKQIVIIHKSIQTYSYTYTWLQMVRPPNPPTGGGREPYVYM